MSDELATTQSHALATQNGGLGIAGLEEVPADILPVPFVKLVQPTSQNVELVDGKEAAVGSYFFTDTKTEIESLEFVILKAKHGEVTFTDKEGKQTAKKALLILGVLPETEKVFILSLSVMSFSGFGKLVAMLKDQKVNAVWERRVIATSHKVENDKGKFYVADFQLGDALTGEEVAQMGEYCNKYAGVVSAKLNVDNEEVVTPIQAEPATPTQPDLSQAQSDEIAEDIPF